MARVIVETDEGVRVAIFADPAEDGSHEAEIPCPAELPGDLREAVQAARDLDARTARFRSEASALGFRVTR